MRKKSREATWPSEAKALQIGDRGHRNSAVFLMIVALNFGILGRKLEGVFYSPKYTTQRFRIFDLATRGGEI